MKEMRHGASVLNFDSKSTVEGGVEDVYGEDRATEDQLVTPWAISVARCHLLVIHIKSFCLSDLLISCLSSKIMHQNFGDLL